MASAKSIAIRRNAAIDRIAAATGADLTVQARDPEMRATLLLEAIADAVEASAKPKRIQRKVTTGGNKKPSI